MKLNHENSTQMIVLTIFALIIIPHFSTALTIRESTTDESHISDIDLDYKTEKANDVLWDSLQNEVISFTDLRLTTDILQEKEASSDLFYLFNDYSQPRNFNLSGYVPGEIILKFNTDTSIDITQDERGFMKTGIRSIDMLNEEYHVCSMEQIFKHHTHSEDNLYDLSTVYTVTLTKDIDINEAAAKYAYDSAIEYAEPNYFAFSFYVPNDPRLDDQWALENIRVFNAWDVEQGNAEVACAIIDTGVDYTHEDLMENIHPVMYDFVNIDTQAYEDAGWILTSGEDYLDEDEDPMDFFGHGTHCAGIAASHGDNGVGIAGVCPHASIMALRAGFSIIHPMYGEIGLYEYEDIAQAIVFAADNDADVISMSWGGTQTSDIIYQAIDYAHTHDVILVAAAGNSNSDILHYPAYYDEVVAVAATAQDDTKAAYSSYGSWVDVAAPGGDDTKDPMILSTVPCTGGIHSDPSGYNYMQGTSMACPHVTGLAGLIRAYAPFYTNDEVAERIIATADNIDDLNPSYAGLLGTDRINATRAIEIFVHNMRVRKMNVYPGYHVQSPETTFLINATIINNGINKETNVSVSLRVNDLLVDSLHFPVFENGTHVPISFSWSPGKVGVYLITINVTIPDVVEDIYWDNEQNQTVIVGVQNIDTGECFDTIQEAIDDPDTRNGHSILVPCGIYAEHVFLYKALALIGTNQTNTVIVGKRSAPIAISIKNIDGVNITGFTLTNGTYGVSIDRSSNVTISNTTIQENTDAGITLHSSNNVFIRNNLIRDNHRGIHVSTGAYRNLITENEFKGNHYGVITDQGSSLTCIYHNNFNNTLNAVDNGSSNTWNDTYYNGFRPSGGNWWSDYIAIDAYSGPNQDILGSDGIGDTPYLICGESENRDQYPLMRPWTEPLPATVFVDDNNTAGPWIGTWYHPYQTIQSALDNASDDDTVFVFNGTYDENIQVNCSIQLTGESTNSTIINGSGSGDIVDIIAHGVTLSGFTIQKEINRGSGVGVHIESEYNTITGNRILNLNKGIYLYGWSHNIISHNIVMNHSYYGILNGKEILPEYPSTDVVITGNIVCNNRRGIGHLLADDGVVCGNTVDNSVDWGIFLWASNNNVVEDNTVTYTTGTEPGYGIYIFDTCCFNIVRDNTVHHNAVTGIFIDMSAFSTIVDNCITNNGIGIKFVISSCFNTIRDNQITGNFLTGVYLSPTSHSNTLFHNNLIQIRFNAYDYADGNDQNFWDNGYPSGGNYWSNYNGEDNYHGPDQNISGSDGIGDSPYSISGGSNQDLYPLMNPWIPGDLDHDGDVDIGDLALLLASYNQDDGGDLDDDDDTDNADLAILLAYYGTAN